MMELRIEDIDSVTSIMNGGEDDDILLIIPNDVKVIDEEAFGYTNVNPSITELKFEPNGRVEIWGSAFMYSNLEKVNFSNSVVRIDNCAFEKCTALREVAFGENLEIIGARAFLDNIKIETLKLPEGLRIIEAQAFQGCKALKKIFIPDSVNEIGTGAFNQCDSLKELHCNTDNLDRFIASFNASKKPLMVVRFLEGSCTCASELGEKTISYIQRNQKTLIDLIVSRDNDIAMGALLALPIKENCKYLSAVEKTAGPKVRGVLLDMFNKTERPKKAEDLLLEDVTEKPKTVAEWKKVFRLTNIDKNEICVGPYKEYETGVVIPQIIGKRKVTKLKETFRGNTSITSVYLPECLNEIGSYSFSGCSALEQITIPGTVRSIGNGAFEGCIALAEIQIPEGVSTIGSCAFKDCTNISSIIFPDSVKRIGSKDGYILFGSVFEGCTKLESIELSAHLQFIPDCAFRECISLKSVVLPNGIEEIGGFAFSGCKELKTIIIPASVQFISPDWAFSGCPILVIQTPTGSYAEQYANEHGIPVLNI